MAEHREPVELRLDDNFTGRMRAAANAAHALTAALARADATWEPHDWSEF